MQYQIRDLNPLDYDACGEIIAEPYYAQLFATSELSELHATCCSATVAADQDNQIIAFLITASSP